MHDHKGLKFYITASMWSYAAVSQETPHHEEAFVFCETKNQITTSMSANYDKISCFVTRCIWKYRFGFFFI